MWQTYQHSRGAALAFYEQNKKRGESNYQAVFCQMDKIRLVRGSSCRHHSLDPPLGGTESVHLLQIPPAEP